MTEPAQSAPGERLQFWEERERRSLYVMPYVMLVVAMALDTASRSGLTRQALIDVGLAAGSLVWMVAIELVQRRGGGPTVMAAMFAVLIGLSAALVIREPVYGFYSFTGYIWAFRTLSANTWLRLVGLALVAMLSAIAQTGAGPYDSAGSAAMLAGVFVINAGVAGFFTWFAWVGQQQKDRRVRLISELTEANERLAESLQQNAELQEKVVASAREAGVAAERRRLAREIHDTLAQGLAGIITQLQAAERAGYAMGPGSKHLQAAVDLARESLSEARRSVEALRPEPLDGVRLPDAMQAVAARWSKLHGVPVSVTTTGRPRVMRPEIEVALLRTAQEALANVARHAHANRVGLTLSYMEDLVTLDVRDDGIGFEVPAGRLTRTGVSNGPSGGFGLAAMHQRVEGVAGMLQVESEPQAGTAISASVPAIPAGAAK
jgi:signal transduction histidine kinase